MGTPKIYQFFQKTKKMGKLKKKKNDRTIGNHKKKKSNLEKKWHLGRKIQSLLGWYRA